MINILYTNSDRVLAVAGLSSEDLSDTFMTARDFPTMLSVDLFGWLPDHASVYLADKTGATALASFNSDCLALYCAYFCAMKLLESPLEVFLKESDGQNEYGRYGNIDFKAILTKLTSQVGYYRQTLLSSMQASNVSVRVPQMTVVSPGFDPVTG